MENLETVIETGIDELDTTITDDNKTFTKAEVDAMLQREADRRVSEALKKQELKTSAKIKEAEKLAKMNESQKYEYELQQREQAIASKERELSLLENKNEASKILSEKGISLSLVDFVVAEDAETMNQNINILEKAFKQSVKAEVEKRLSTNTPKRNLAADDGMTKEAFKKLSLKEQQDMIESNPEMKKFLLR